MAPIVRTGADGERELVMACWGMPGPPRYGGAPVTNIRNLTSPHWQGWLGRRNRCLVPATSFCEYADTKPRKTPIWFALSEDRPLFAFAGLWTPWHGVRGPKSAPVEGRHELFGFLTTEANAIVALFTPRPCRSFSLRPKRRTLGVSRYRRCAGASTAAGRRRAPNCRHGREGGQKPRVAGLIRIAVSARAAIKATLPVSGVASR